MWKAAAWIVFVAAGLAGWNIPLGTDEFNFTGWLWFFESLVLLGLAATGLATVFRCSHYLLFLAYGLMTLAVLQGEVQHRNIQVLVQLAVPAIAWVVGYHAVRRGQGAAETNVSVPMAPLVLAAALLTLPLILKWLSVAECLNVRPAAITAVLLAACFLGHVIHGRSKAWLGVAWAAGFCFLTESRMATAAVFVLTTFLLAYRAQWLRRAALMLLLTAAVIAYYQSDSFQQRFFYTGEGTWRDLLRGNFSSSGRFSVWPYAWDEAWDAPLFGHGSGSSHSIAPLLSASAMSHLHNDYLKVFYEFGIVGFILFWTFFLRQWVQCARHTYLARVPDPNAIIMQCGLALTGLFIMSVTDNGLLYTANVMVPLFFLMGTCRRLLPSEHGFLARRHRLIARLPLRPIQERRPWPVR